MEGEKTKEKATEQEEEEEEEEEEERLLLLEKERKVQKMTSSKWRWWNLPRRGLPTKMS